MPKIQADEGKEMVQIGARTEGTPDHAMSVSVVSLLSASKAEIDIQQYNPTDSDKSISLLPFLFGGAEQIDCGKPSWSGQEKENWKVPTGVDRDRQQQGRREKCFLQMMESHSPSPLKHF